MTLTASGWKDKGRFAPDKTAHPGRFGEGDFKSCDLHRILGVGFATLATTSIIFHIFMFRFGLGAGRSTL